MITDVTGIIPVIRRDLVLNLPVCMSVLLEKNVYQPKRVKFTALPN